MKVEFVITSVRSSLFWIGPHWVVSTLLFYLSQTNIIFKPYSFEPDVPLSLTSLTSVYQLLTYVQCQKVISEKEAVFNCTGGASVWSTCIWFWRVRGNDKSLKYENVHVLNRFKPESFFKAEEYRWCEVVCWRDATSGMFIKDYDGRKWPRRKELFEKHLLYFISTPKINTPTRQL